MRIRYFLILSFLMLLLSACGGGGSGSNDSASDDDLTSKNSLANRAAYIPSQCYTKTIDENGQAHNPCMSCHIPTTEPNYLDDGDLQLSYTFAQYANTNHWTNLFKDRSQQIASISDDAILAYVRENNYKSQTNELDLADKLRNVPSGWDFNKDGRWSGYIPDCYMAFDEEGFDRDPEQSYTGWRAFGYAPFLGTFWPTNGSTDDVMIRLSQYFRQNTRGEFDLETYKINLAIVEALIKKKDITLGFTVDESLYGVDLDKDNSIGNASKVAYDWAPLKNRYMSYVGMAKIRLEAGELHLAAGLYPEGTEFLHSVRYLDLNDNNEVIMSARMKELRHARKAGWRTYTQLEDQVLAEIKEKEDFPDRLRQLIGNVEQGISNGQGWIYQGFIEDKEGALRPQTFEETTACMGCHGGIGATTDSSFAFPRKFSGSASFRQGWYHWSQKGLKGTPEPRRADGQYEYTHYLEHNGAGDEFRENQEVIDKFFTPQGQLRSDVVARLHNDVTELLLPSSQRALLLNKAYKAIVDEQSYIYGRDTMINPPDNVHDKVEDEQETGVETIIRGPNDLSGD